MSDAANPFAAFDPFMRFWTEFAGRCAAAGAPPPSPPADLLSQMRRAFFDALAQQADQFLRGEAFLAVMKQTMESSLAWQQTLNQFLQKGLSASQIPSRADADHVVVLLRGLEERLHERLDDLARRIERVESVSGLTQPAR